MAPPRLKNRRNTGTAGTLQLMPIIQGSIWALSASLVVFALYAVLLRYTPLPERTVPIVTVLTSLVAVFIGGLKAAGRATVNGWLHGILTSFVYYIVVVAIGILLYDKVLSLAAVWGFIPLLVAGAIGGVFGIK